MQNDSHLSRTIISNLSIAEKMCVSDYITLFTDSNAKLQIIFRCNFIITTLPEVKPDYQGFVWTHFVQFEEKKDPYLFAKKLQIRSKTKWEQNK
jgi:hypothetical protein